MTTEELEKINIDSCRLSLYPRRYIVPYMGECTIPENWTVEDIFFMIYTKGFNVGKESGKEEKAEEIRHCLNI